MLAGLLLAGCAAAPSGDPARTRQEVEAGLAELLAAFERNDPGGMAEVFATDGILSGPQQMRVQGRDAIERYWRERPRPLSWRIETIEVSGGPDEPWQRARSIRRVGPGPADTTVTDFFVVWKRDAQGRLRISLDFWN
jgi:ketosteroid isomerase-like protein